MPNVSERMRELRTDCCLIQQELSNYLGVTQQTYSRYETAELAPSIKYLIMLADFYDVSVDYIVGVTNVRTRYMRISEER